MSPTLLWDTKEKMIYPEGSIQFINKLFYGGVIGFWVVNGQKKYICVFFSYFILLQLSEKHKILGAFAP